MEIKNKLLKEYEQKTNSRRRAMTEVNTMVSQSRRKEDIPNYEQKGFVKNDYRSSTALKRDNTRDNALYEPF